MAVFDQAYKLYKKYGAVRTVATEFEEFKGRHKDWRKVLPLLLPAIEYQAAWRARHTGWVAEWKNFKTWLGKQRAWEDHYPEQTHSEPDGKMAERKKADARRLYTAWLKDPKISQDEKMAWAKNNDYMWLVDEIQAKE
jgi:hypothetical protein